MGNCLYACQLKLSEIELQAMKNACYRRSFYDKLKTYIYKMLNCMKKIFSPRHKPID